VRSSCCFFHVRAQAPLEGHAIEGHTIEGPDAEQLHTITVTPNDGAIQQHAAFLAKARYVEEHFTVYNTRDLNEHKQVLVRLSCGRQQTQAFSYAPSRPIYSSSVLEEDILSFHCSFKAFWDANFTSLLEATAQHHSSMLTLSSHLATEPPAESTQANLIAALTAKCEAVGGDSTYQQLWFDFRHITDELVFYGMKAQTTHFVTPLANLCYKMLFHHEVFDIFVSASSKHRRLPLLPSTTEPRPLPAPLFPWIKQLSYFLHHFPDAHAGIEPLRRLERHLLRHTRATEAAPEPEPSHAPTSTAPVEGTPAHVDTKRTQTGHPCLSPPSSSAEKGVGDTAPSRT